MVIDGVVKAGSAIILLAGAFHNLFNTSDEPMRVTMLYGPPNFVEDLVQTTKVKALASHEAFEDATTE